MDTTRVMWIFFFSQVGLASFYYGRRQRRGVPLLAGTALMFYPYFVTDVYALVGLGAALVVGLFVGSRIETNW